MDEKTLKEIRQLIKDATHVCFLGGAGVSTGSGILDFRSPQGIYNITSKYGVPYEVMLSHDYFFDHTEEFYDFYWSTMVNLEAKPNKAHEALAQFEKRRGLTVITQNIDGLHQMAGSKNVLEAHGSIHRYECVNCGRKFRLDQIQHHGVPKCACGGIIKPDVVLYQEPLDEDTMTRAVVAVEYANVLIIGGTSMKVYPVAGLPQYFRMGKQIMINAEPTPYDRYCDYVIHEDIGETLEAILGE